MFDFNCDVAQSYGVYKNSEEFEIAKYASSINISAGFHCADPLTIRQALLFAKENNIALGVHVGYPDIQGFGKRKIELNNEELEAIIIYQIGAVMSFAKTFDLEVEQVRAHGALKDLINNDEKTAIVVSDAIKKINPWLNLIVQNDNTKKIIQNNGLKAALEVEYSENMTLKEIEELEIKVDTIHFKTLDEIKNAYKMQTPTPINYNRVENQI